MTCLTNEDRQIANGCVRLRGAEAWSIAVMRARGEEQKAQALLDALNMFPRAFGQPLFVMPEPATTGLSDWLTCPAEQLVEVEHLGPGRIAA